MYAFIRQTDSALLAPAYREPYDALTYSTGPYLARVERGHIACVKHAGYELHRFAATQALLRVEYFCRDHKDSIGKVFKENRLLDLPRVRDVPRVVWWYLTTIEESRRHMALYELGRLIREGEFSREALDPVIRVVEISAGPIITAKLAIDCIGAAYARKEFNKHMRRIARDA